MRFEWQPYRFTGKELITEHGLNRYDSKARIQDFQIPGFTTLDPLCENYYGISPYSYCAGNPVRYVDPDGRDLKGIGVFISDNTTMQIKKQKYLPVKNMNERKNDLIN